MTLLTKLPLEGEILGPQDCVTVIAALHPFRMSHVRFRAPSGSSIAELIEFAETVCEPGHVLSEIHASIGEHPIPPENWTKVRVKAGQTVILRAVARGGGGSLLKSILMIAVAILVGLVMPWLALSFGPIGASLIGGAITIGASLPVAALFPVTLRRPSNPEIPK